MDNEPPSPQQPVLPQQPAVAPVSPPPQPVLPPVKKSKKPLIVASAILVILIIAVVIVLVVGHKSNSSKTTSQSDQTSSKSSSVKSSSPPNSASTSDSNVAARNSKRQSDIEALQTQAEAYFQQSGYYPSLTDINSASWRAANMSGIDNTALVDPSSSCDPTTAACLVAAPVAKSYAYAVTDSSGNSCESDDTQCAQYTLTATYEGSVNGATTFSKQNLD